MWHFFLVPCVDFLQLLGTCSLELAEKELSHLYLSLCWKSSASGNLGSWPNMMKNGLSLECSLGRKLYAAVARVHTSSHSTLGLTCLARHVFKKV